MKTKKSKKTKLEKAVKILTKKLKKDDALFLAWQSSIAMSFKDVYTNALKDKDYSYMNRNDIHNIANTAAEDFLTLLIGKK